MQTSAGAFSKDIEEKNAQPGEYLANRFTGRHQLNHTLILLDIDDTVLTSPAGQWLGSSVMFFGLMDEALQKHPDWSRRQAADYLDPLLLHIYTKVPMILVDPSLPKAINDLKKRGATVIGMTSRGLITKDVTLWQLEQCGISFSDTGSRKNTKLPDGRVSLIENGVVFVSHGNRKGEVLNSLLNDKAEPFRDIQHITMIDDQKRHLIDIGETLTEQFYIPVLCTFPDSQPKYNHTLAVQQLRNIVKQEKDSDSIIKEMMNSDPFTMALMKSG
nr:DUF2608 domain-containing protein [Sansalvadorimonas sp. 2012CJ34-2]